MCSLFTVYLAFSTYIECVLLLLCSLTNVLSFYCSFGVQHVHRMCSLTNVFSFYCLLGVQRRAFRVYRVAFEREHISKRTH